MVREVIVVGAGVFGVWTAFHLAAAGVRVTLVDAYGAGNSRSSSSDESRILRCGYGGDEIYSRMARRSLDLWRSVDDGTLWHPCGVLWLASGADAYTAATRATLEAAEFPLLVLESRELQARYPHLSCDGIELALLESDGGVLMARRAVQHLAGALAGRGVAVSRGRVLPADDARRLDAVHLDDGRRLSADAFVFACGAWLPQALPGAVGARIRPTRQMVVYFGTPPGDDRFGASRTPAWIDFPAGIYGVPDIEGRGVKVGIDEHGPPFDPDTGDRTPDAPSIDRARAWLARRAPALASAPVVETRVCQYENTSTGDFLIDRHPDCSNVWIAGGGSGHGFKHGPAVGEIAAGLVLSEQAVNEPRFAFASKTAFARRTVF
jgi:glycine/D-amino acid oxidase-like deaminating enzyme